MTLRSRLHPYAAIALGGLLGWLAVSTRTGGVVAAASPEPAASQGPAKKPNIVIIWGDDIGQSNLGAYSRGMMGYRTPNIDRVARGGMMFTDYYAEQSCIAIYCNDDQQVTSLRYDNGKLVFLERRAPGTLRVWAEPFTTLRVPKMYNLRLDPYERADITSNTYYDWLIDHAFLALPAQDLVGKFLLTFREYPRRQKAASFNLDEVMETLKEVKSK